MSEPSFEFPVRIVSRQGADTWIARCNGYTASSTMTPEIAMQRAAAKALNKSGKLAADFTVMEWDIELRGAGRSRTAVYSFNKNRACRVCGCTDEDCRQCIEKTGEPCSWVQKDLCSACMGSFRPKQLGARKAVQS